MRRIVSILVTLLFGLTPILSAMPAEALASSISAALSGQLSSQANESSLPRCCRRNGVHHCNMGSENQVDQHDAKATNQFASVSANNCCPCRQTTLASVAPTFAATAPVSAAFQLSKIEVLRPASIAAPASAGQHRDWPKRGPPSATQTL